MHKGTYTSTAKDVDEMNDNSIQLTEYWDGKI